MNINLECRNTGHLGFDNDVPEATCSRCGCHRSIKPDGSREYTYPEPKGAA